VKSNNIIKLWQYKSKTQYARKTKETSDLRKKIHTHPRVHALTIPNIEGINCIHFTVLHSLWRLYSTLQGDYSGQFTHH